MFVLELGLIGACIALLPLSWAWMKADDNRFRKLVWVTTFMTMDLVMFGGFTRLTDSGLGCPDWPGCYGTSSPFIAHAQIAAAYAAMPEGPVSMMKAWIEMIHRYFATSIGVVILVQMVIAWAVFFHQRPVQIPSGIRKIFATLYEDCRALRISPWWPTSLALLIIVQGIFGAWTVTMKLQPIIVSTHLLLGLALLGALGWFSARLTPLPAYDPGALRWRWAALIGLALLALQIALGGWVSTNYAALACTEFPTCNAGAWIPPMDFHHGFQLWRALGVDSSGEALTQDALVAIHWTHRMFAFAVVAYLAWLAVCLRRFASMRRPANWVLVVIVIQFLTGLSNIVLARPLLVAVAHNGGAAILLLLVVMLNFRAFAARPANAAQA